MLEKAFIRRMFDVIEQASDEVLAEKEAAIAKHASTFPKNSEAAMDARFMLRHIRRERAERLFRPPLAS